MAGSSPGLPPARRWPGRSLTSRCCLCSAAPLGQGRNARPASPTSRLTPPCLPAPEYPTGVAEVEPQEHPLAGGLLEQVFDLRQGDPRFGHPAAVCVVGDEEVVAAVDSAVPCEVHENRLIRRRPCERGLKCGL